MIGRLELTPGQVARALGMDVSAIYRAIDAGELVCEQNPVTKRKWINGDAFVVYAAKLTGGAPAKLPDPQGPTIGAVRQVVEPILERIGAELAAMNRRLEAFEALMPPAGRVAAPVDRLARQQEAAIAVNRDQTSATLTDAAARIAAMKRNAGVTS